MTFVSIEPCPRCGADAEVTRDGKHDYEEWDCPNCGTFSSFGIEDYDYER